MKISKFLEYIKENMNDTPENYAEQALRSILEKIKKMFPEDENQQETEDEVISFAQARAMGDKKEKDEKNLKFKDYGTRLVDIALSRTASTLTLKLEEENSWYSLIFMIDLKDAVPKDQSTDFTYEDIENCKVKFKRYNKADQIEGIPVEKTVKISDIDEDLLVELKIDVDGEETEGLGIETE